MAVNLATKYQKQFAAAFKPNSYFEGKTSTAYDWLGGDEIAVYSPVLAALENYQRTGASRYGTVTEMDTAVQKMKLTQDKSFTKALDRGNYTEQMMAISGGAWMNEEIKGVMTPTTEKYAVAEWIKNAGSVLTMAAAPAKSTVIEALLSLITAQDNLYVPEDGRFLYIRATDFAIVQQSPEFLALDKLGEKAIGKGHVGEISGAKVVKLPDSFFPADAYAMLARKDSILLPRTISTFKTHQNPPGIDGWLMEGRVRYDAFVLGAKASGVAALVKTSSKQATPTIAHSSNSLTITSASATAIKYTLDGTDPRYSDSAEVYSGAVSTSGWASGKYTVKAVAYGTFTSDVKEFEVTIS